MTGCTPYPAGCGCGLHMRRWDVALHQSGLQLAFKSFLSAHLASVSARATFAIENLAWKTVFQHSNDMTDGNLGIVAPRVPECYGG